MVYFSFNLGYSTGQERESGGANLEKALDVNHRHRIYHVAQQSRHQLRKWELPYLKTTMAVILQESYTLFLLLLQLSFMPLPITVSFTRPSLVRKNHPTLSYNILSNTEECNKFHNGENKTCYFLVVSQFKNYSEKNHSWLL